MIEFLQEYWRTLCWHVVAFDYVIYYIGVFLISMLALYQVGYRKKSIKRNGLLKVGGLLGYFATVILLVPLVALLDQDLKWATTFFCVAFWLWLISGNTFKEVLFAVAVGFCLEFSISRIIVLINMYLPSTLPRIWRMAVRYLNRIGLYAVMMVGGSFLFKRFIPKNQGVHLSHELWLIIIIIILMVSNLDATMSASDVKTNLLGTLLQIAFAITLLIVLFGFIKRRFVESERARLERFILDQNEHYSQIKQYVELMNIKYHDFKQNVNYALETGAIDEKNAKAMLDIMEGFAGFEFDNNINMLIKDKLLLCERRGINCIYTIEKNCFYALAWTDTVALMNNIFYNAIEHVSSYENKDNRIINFKSYIKNGFLLIQCENYCENFPEFVDGLPITTKEDAVHHGYGFKSIRYIVEKYNGSLQILAPEEEKLFKVNILIPLN